jgi:hypothetical protein
MGRIVSANQTFMAMLGAGLDQESHFDITGSGLVKIKQDADVIKAQSEIIAGIKENPRFGNEAYTPNDKSSTVHLGQQGSLLADTGDETFWMVHYGDLSATNIEASEDGALKITWNIHDTFNFRPSEDKGSFYNALAWAVGGIYHDVFGATDQMKTDATWTTITCPDGSVVTDFCPTGTSPR